MAFQRRGVSASLLVTDGSQFIPGWCYFSLCLTLHSSAPQRNSFPRGVYDHRPHDQMSLCDTLNADCLDIQYLQKIVRTDQTSKRVFPRCSREDRWCDVDENLWLNAENWVD